MIIIVTHFRSEVVKFILGGRNSGRNAKRKKDDAYFWRNVLDCEMAR